MATKRVAVSTSGGDCPGLNAVLRAVVHVGVGRYGWEVLGIEDGLSGLLDLSYKSPHGNRWLTPQDMDDYLCRGGTRIGTTNRGHPFRYPVKQGDIVVETDVSDRVMENFRALELDALISIGGDGSMEIAQRFFLKGLPVVGVPKTIDNDLAATDVTFGFQSAVNVATEALDRLRDTGDSHDRVMIVEAMGRHAGFIALEAGLAGGAHVILLPEIPYKTAHVAKFLNERRAQGHNFSLIVVAEGARGDDGEVSAVPAKPGEMARLMGAAARLEHNLTPLIQQEIRVTVLGHVQRGGSPCAFDRVLATRFGAAAAELVQKGRFGRMVALRTPDIVDVTIAEALTKPRRVDPESQPVQTARSLGVCFGDA